MTTIAFPAEDASWKSAYRAANLLARDGVTPLWATQAFKGRTRAGEDIAFDAGTIVLAGAATNKVHSAAQLKSRLGADAIELADATDCGGSPLGSIWIAVYGGGGPTITQRFIPSSDFSSSSYFRTTF